MNFSSVFIIQFCPSQMVYPKIAIQTRNSLIKHRCFMNFGHYLERKLCVQSRSWSCLLVPGLIRHNLACRSGVATSVLLGFCFYHLPIFVAQNMLVSCLFVASHFCQQDYVLFALQHSSVGSIHPPHIVCLNSGQQQIQFEIVCSPFKCP